MSRWIKEFEQHEFHGIWSDLKSKFDDERLNALSDITSVFELARLKKVVTYIDELLVLIDPELINSGAISNMNQATIQCRNELNAFIGNLNIGHLQNSNNYIDNVLSIVRSFTTIPKNPKSAITAAVISYNKELGKYLRSLEKITSEQNLKYTESVKEVNQWYNEQNKFINEMKLSSETIKQTIEGQTAEFNRQFQESEQSRQVKFEKVIDALDSKSDVEFEKLAEKLGTILKVAQSYEDQIKRVLNVVVNTAQAGSYKTYANEEKKSANYYRYAAIFLMFFGVSLIIVPEMIHFIDNMQTYIFDWKNGAQRGIVSMIMFVPAFYLAKESSKHRANEIKNRQRELVLSTIDPYIELLSTDKKEDLKSEIAKKIFGESDSPQSKEDSTNFLAQLTNFMTQIDKFRK